MMTSDSKELLRDFSRNRSEEAFRALVRQHSPVVYGTALRKLGGDRAAAQDVAQEVFTLLARKADRLESVVLGGWLYRQACRQAANHVRTESRRKRRESFAVENGSISSAPEDPINESLTEELDDALLALPDRDRDVLILRFFEGKEFKSLGAVLGLSEEAARKRVIRALERLAGNLKRKGIAVGSVSLGTAMQGFGAAPVPVGMISTVSDTALKSAGAGGWTTFFAWVKPVIAGVAATSLAAGSALALRTPDHESTVAKAGSPPMSSRGQRSSRVAEKPAEHPTLEQIIAEIRRIRSGPDTTLTELRLKVALGKIGISQIPGFVRLGNKQLNEAERDATYGLLLGTWWRKDHEEALDFMLEMLRMPQAPPNTFYVRSFFGKWESEDPASSCHWLFRRWDDPILLYPAFNDSLRGDLAKGAVSRMFGNGRITEIFDFISLIPKVSDQAEALKPLTGQADTHGIWHYSEERKDQWLQVYRGLEKIPDARCRMELTRNFWKEIGENHPTKVAEIQKFIQPAEPFAVSLGLLSVKVMPNKRTTNVAGGETIHYEAVTDTESRIEAAMEAGASSGLSRDSVSSAITDIMREGGNEASRTWVENHPEERGSDSSLANLVRNTTGAASMDEAAKIRDPHLRRGISRGTFRRLLYNHPDEARNYLNGSAVPPDLAEELKAIATETP